jgi:hypothetical protein
VESVEKQKQLSHSFHRPLEISQTTRDFHIPTARLRGPGKMENQKQVSHFPRAARDGHYCSLSENQQPKKGSRPLRGLLIPYPFSFRSNGTGFMLILRLENAGWGESSVLLRLSGGAAIIPAKATQRSSANIRAPARD